MDTYQKTKDNNEFLAFSEDQWDFLAVLSAFGTPVSIDVVGILSPLMPGPLIDLLETAVDKGWIKRIKNKRLIIGEEIPPQILEKLKLMNNPKRLAALVDRILNENLSGQIDKDAFARVLLKAGRMLSAAQIEMELAEQAAENTLYEEQFNHLEKAVAILATDCDTPEASKLFIFSILQLADVSFALGKGLPEIEPYLHQAHKITEKTGDMRSRALINLHLGWFTTLLIEGMRR